MDPQHQRMRWHVHGGCVEVPAGEDRQDIPPTRVAGSSYPAANSCSDYECTRARRVCAFRTAGVHRDGRASGRVVQHIVHGLNVLDWLASGMSEEVIPEARPESTRKRSALDVRARELRP